MATIRRRGIRWHAQVRRAGASTQTKSFPSKALAQEWARDIESSIDKGLLPPSRSPLGGITFASLLQRYAEVVSPKKRGASEELYRLRKLLAEPMTRLPLAQVTHTVLSTYRDQRLMVACLSTVRREFVLIRHCFEIARTDWGLPLSVNPASGVRFGGHDVRRERRLLSGEFEQLEAMAIKSRNPLVWSIIKFAIATSMRRGEILAMRWEHVQLVAQCLLIPHTKNGQARVIPLSRHAIALLESLRAREGLVFPMKANALRLAWARLTRRAGIDNLHFHDLRHEAISRFFELGLSTPEVALISGHRDVRMLFRYTHPMRDRIIGLLNAQEEDVVPAPT